MASAHEAACARVAVLFPQRWLRHYAASKLRRDGIFEAAYNLLGDSSAPVLDVGCGVGLLSFYLRERGFAQPITGVDVDARKIRGARAAVAKNAYEHLTFLDGKVPDALPAGVDNVVLFDLLHYLAPVDQKTLLLAAAARVAPGGMLLLRDCPRDGSPRFWATYLAERFAQAISWNLSVPLHFATRDSINAAFCADRFTAEERPMWSGSPFNNRLFIFRRK